MSNFRAANEETNFSCLSRLAPEGFGTTRGGSVYTEEYIAPTVSNVQRNECRFIPHAGEPETSIGVHGCGGADLREGGQKIHGFAKKKTTDGRGSYIHMVGKVGSVAAGLWSL